MIHDAVIQCPTFDARDQSSLEKWLNIENSEGLGLLLIAFGLVSGGNEVGILRLQSALPSLSLLDA